MPFTTITSWARMIWDALRTYGIDPDEVFRDAGLDPELLDDPNERYPARAMARLWEYAEARAGDPCFGLTAAAQWHPTTWHGLGFAWLASATIEEALRRLVRYSAVISTAADFRIDDQDGALTMVIAAQHGSGIDPNPVVMDAVTANIVQMARMTFGPEFRPQSVSLTHDGCGCRQRRQEFFRSPIYYGAERIAVTIDLADARHPLSSANAELAYANEKVIRDYLAQLSGSPTVMRVKARLIDGMPSGVVPAGVIAAELNMSSRSLQRKLREEGTTYKAVLEETRRELAQRLIDDDDLTLSDITYMLGFSEVSSFSRSFKRWTGMSPSARRRGEDLTQSF